MFFFSFFYRCIATNQAGSMDRTAVITVRPRQSRPQREKLTISPSAVNVGEGQSTRVVCTGSANIPSGSIGWTRYFFVKSTLYLNNVSSEYQGIFLTIRSFSQARWRRTYPERAIGQWCFIHRRSPR